MSVLTEDKPKIGRPSIKTQEVIETICTRISNGESLLTICNDDEMPGFSTVIAWLDKDEAFQAKYARARTIQADHLAEEILNISDDATNDYSTDEDGNPIVDHENIQRSRLRVDSRKWYASKLLPKKYGDTGNKTEVNVSTAIVVLDPQKQQELQERRRVAEHNLGRETPKALELQDV